MFRALLPFSACVLVLGCQPPISLISPPTPQPAQPVTVKLVIDGEGRINVGGEGKIVASSVADPLDTSQRCTCGCGKDGCTCSRGASSAAQTTSTSTKRSAPQVIQQTERRWLCVNGRCGWYDVPVNPAAASNGLASAAPGGKIKVYVADDPASVAMRAALRDVKGIDFDRGNPPANNGLLWWPTAVKTDGSTWTPGATGWHSQSLSQFLQWRER